MPSLKNLDLELIDEALTQLAAVAPTRPAAGWARTIRDGLGMTRAQLAERIGVTPATISDLEKSEARGSVTLESLEKLARGLEGRLVYAIVPATATSFQRIVEDRAEQIAKKRLQRVSHSMSLEDQPIEQKRQATQLKQIIDSLLRGSRRILWR